MFACVLLHLWVYDTNFLFFSFFSFVHFIPPFLTELGWLYLDSWMATDMAMPGLSLPDILELGILVVGESFSMESTLVALWHRCSLAEVVSGLVGLMTEQNRWIRR